MIDLEHLSLKPDSPNYNPDAMGWARYEPRTDGLYAVQVSWTSEGKERIEARKQRYISPAIKIDKGRRMMSLINVALTALPAMHDPMPLIAASKRTETRKLLWAAIQRFAKGNK